MLHDIHTRLYVSQVTIRVIENITIIHYLHCLL